MEINLRLATWIAVGLLAAWFIAMSINRNYFLHYDSTADFRGTVAARLTDLGIQCGGALNPNELIEYKLNEKGQLAYLCPQTLWPLQKVVIAQNVTMAFRNSLPPLQLEVLTKFYPLLRPNAETPTANPFIQQ